MQELKRPKSGPSKENPTSDLHLVIHGGCRGFAKLPMAAIARRTLTIALLGTALFACAIDESHAPDTENWTAPSVDTQLYPVAVARPTSAIGLNTTHLESNETAAAIVCATCHLAGSTPAFSTRPGAPGNYHVHVKIEHGGLTCPSCHVPGKPGWLHRAGGQRFPLVESMELCSQCHGPQRRNYDHGAHGGMRGYWDRARGPRQRNDCIICHAAHSPAYPKVTPVRGPRDPFVKARHHGGSLVERRYGKKGSHE